MAELRPNIVFHVRHFVRHLGICNPLCVNLLQVMSAVILSNLKEKRRLYFKPFSWGPQTRYTHTQTHTHRHTHTHDDGIRRNAMRCISPKNTVLLLYRSLIQPFLDYCNISGQLIQPYLDYCNIIWSTYSTILRLLQHYLVNLFNHT